MTQLLLGNWTHDFCELTVMIPPLLWIPLMIFLMILYIPFIQYNSIYSLPPLLWIPLTSFLKIFYIPFLQYMSLSDIPFVIVNSTLIPLQYIRLM